MELTEKELERRAERDAQVTLTATLKDGKWTAQIALEVRGVKGGLDLIPKLGADVVRVRAEDGSERAEDGAQRLHPDISTAAKLLEFLRDVRIGNELVFYQLGRHDAAALEPADLPILSVVDQFFGGPGTFSPFLTDVSGVQMAASSLRGMPDELEPDNGLWSRDGDAWALMRDGQRVCTLDIDGTFEPADIVFLPREGADAVRILVEREG